MTPASSNISTEHDASPPENWLRCGVLVALLAASSTASTDQTRTTLGVSASVTAVARLEQLNSSPELLVTAQDLDRGFIDCPELVHLIVYSNSRSGYALDVHSVSPVFSALSVQGLGLDVRLPADGGTVTQRWSHPQKVSLALKFSFVLADGVQPGRYPWPVRLAARPLDQ